MNLLLPVLLAVAGATASPAPSPAGTPVMPDAAALVMGNNGFAFDLYARLAAEPGATGNNLFLSPNSISAALSMAWTGARGATSDEMGKALHSRLEPARFHAAFADLLKGLAGDGSPRPWTLSIANALWKQKGVAFLDPFLAATASYGASAQDVDFAVPGTADTINDWVKAKTAGHIEKLVGPLDATTRLVLTNAVYFKGDWTLPFRPEFTRREDFFGPSGKTPADLMHLTGHFRCSADAGAQLLELPYQGGALSMIVLLPTTPDGLPALEKTLSNDRLTALLLRATSKEVEVTFPKFKLSDRHSLGPILSAMGMPSAFSDLKADFSGMTGKRGISITQVVHQADVEVDEKGTVAAAATGVTMGIRAMTQPVVFRADHPFVFLIRDVKSGSILFLGRVVKP